MRKPTTMPIFVKSDIKSVSMKRNTLLIATSLILSFISGSIFASTISNDYQNAWTEFFRNNRTEARAAFTRALNNPATKADANLALCLMDWSESKLESAFDRLQDFYKSSDQPDAFIYALYTMPFSFADGNILEEKKRVFLEDIVTRPMNGTLKAMIYETLGKHYTGCKEFDKAKELYARTGALYNWQVLGTFNNISGSGFDKDWGAVQNSRTKDTFENKTGATVHWYSPGLNKPDGWFDFTYYFSSGNNIAYAQTFLTSAEAQDVIIRIGTSGSLKVWVNDVLTGSVKDERNCDMDLYAYKIKLNKGANRILLQLGQSDISSLNFMARITDENGDPVKGISDSAEYTKYTKSSSQASNNLLPFYPEAFIQEKIKENPGNPLYPILLAETYLRNDKAEEAILLLRDVQKEAPKSSLIHYRLAEAYMRAQNRTYYTKQIEDIKIDDPESLYALENLSEEAISSDKITEVKNLCQKIKDLYGENLTTRALDMWLASKQGKQEEYIGIIKAYYEKYPYKYEYVNGMFNIEEYTLKNSKAATKIIEDYCAKYFTPSALENLSSRYMKEGDTEKALSLLRDRIELMPYAMGFLRNYASTLHRMQRYDEALQITERMNRLNPYAAYNYSLRADIYKSMKNEKQAIENYKKSIYYNPSLFESRTQLRQLEGKKEMEELFPRYNLDSLIAKAPTQEDYPDDNSVIVLYDTKFTHYPEGSSEFHQEIAVKILNHTGIETWKEYSVPYYNNQRLTLDKSEIIKPNGQKVKAETSGGYVVFTNLEVGDVLYLEYRIKDYSTDVLSKHFYDQEIFQFALPTMVISYSILAPRDKKFDHIVANGKITPQISYIENMKLHRWVLTDQPAIRVEPVMGSFLDIAPTLSFSSVPDWKFISNWYKDLTTNKFKDDYLLRETVDEILKGKENTSDLEKAQLFYEYILKNITYSNVPFMQNNFIPQKASRTLSTRLGDCKDVSTLFVAMCRRVGIKANLVLILTRDNGNNILPLPANSFNHCIARLEIGGKTYYLELTDNKLPFGSALEVDLQSPILPIPYGNEAMGEKLLKMDMPFRTTNLTKRKTEMSFANNDIITKVTSIRYGSSASGFRHAYFDLGNEDRLKQLNQIVASDYTTPIKVTNVSFGDLSSLADSAVYKYEVEAKNTVQEVAGMKIFKIRWIDNISSLEEFSLEERKYPFEFWMYSMEDGNQEELTITLPEGKSLIEIPADIHLECANATYDLKYDSSTPGKIRINRKFTRKTDVVSPQEYPAFKEFMHAVGEGDNRQYAIK